MPEQTFGGFTEPIENWSKLPHNLIEALPIFSSLAEMKVVVYVLRHTWGYGEYGGFKTITMDEFMNGRKRNDGSRIDGGTGMTEPAIRDGIKRAVEDGFLIAVINDSDKGRIRRAFSLNQYREEGENFFPPEGKLLSPREKTSLPRTEKDTSSKKPEKEEGDEPTPKPQRPRNPLFDIVAEKSFGVKDTSLLNGSAGRVGKLIRELKKTYPELSFERMELFYWWYEHEHPGMSHMRDAAKIAVEYAAFLGNPLKHGRPGAPIEAPSARSAEHYS